MQQRKSGRPTGTDGSDFSYRMVVDSRYTQVAKGKSRLYALIMTQAVIQLIGLLSTVMSISNEKGPKALPIWSFSAGLLSLLIGELGRRWSRASFLRVYIIMSSVAALLSLFSAHTMKSTLEVIRNPGNMETKLELVCVFLLILGFPLQVFAISTATSLIGNMSPPKKAC
ncbi:hypothetical protein K2173_013686 [Erythroxylum novogranatense]|uniref:Uncharacterized protein n=1 Tax=Erythroxylum novogranatense TaxID=1862640 RepID=A0AAV8SAA2_9ROSI|nr:hypothetical protein K2173_013686 [Erythroxylum novogranatense]